MGDYRWHMPATCMTWVRCSLHLSQGSVGPLKARMKAGRRRLGAAGGAALRPGLGIPLSGYGFRAGDARAPSYWKKRNASYEVQLRPRG